MRGEVAVRDLTSRFEVASGKFGRERVATELVATGDVANRNWGGGARDEWKSRNVGRGGEARLTGRGFGRSASEFR